MPNAGYLLIWIFTGRVRTSLCLVCHSIDFTIEQNIVKMLNARQNLSSGFPTKQDSNQSSQLQRIARKMKFRS